MRNLNLCALFLLLGMNCLNAQITVVKDSKPVSRILVEKGEAVDNQAALTGFCETDKRCLLARSE